MNAMTGQKRRDYFQYSKEKTDGNNFQKEQGK